MTKLSTVYDAINTRLNSLYGSTHRKIYAPRNLEERVDTKTLARGYGWFFSGAQNNTGETLAKQASVTRTLTVVNTIVTRGTTLDTMIREASEKQLLEDQYLLIKDFEEDVTLGGEVADIRFLSDGGIVDLFGEREDYLLIESTCTVRYFENF